MALPHLKLAILALLGGGLAFPASPPRSLRETYLMGTTLSMSVAAGSRERGFEAIDAALVRVRQVDDLLNDWRRDSRLARINQARPGEPTMIDAELLGYLQEVAAWSAETGGAFDPAIGALVDAWDLRGAGRIPPDSVVARARAASGLAQFDFEPGQLTVQRPNLASWIDAGGFGKGAALRAARDELISQSVRDGILNFGGQILVLGDTTLTIEVAHPRRRDESVASLRLRNASVSTSSQSERSIEVNGRRYGHVLDPRSGVPVHPWGSVTVVHLDPMVADLLSTALFVMGPEQGLRWLEGRKIPALFLIVEGDSVIARWSPSMQKLLESVPSHPRGE